jgi:DNA/RNA-binding domain of Phe-tRNA-synthetase-like protein
VAEQVRIGVSPGLAAEIQDFSENLQSEYGGQKPAAIPALQEARRLYRSIGVDPTRTRPSSEALMRRVLQGKSLFIINNAVDACNLASLNFFLPIGLYDLAKISGEVELRLGKPGEEYPGIRKGMVHLAGRLGLFDAQGPFGSPTSDSSRTCVQKQTTTLLAVIMATACYPVGAMQEHVQWFAELLVRHCAANSTWTGLLPDWEQAS